MNLSYAKVFAKCVRKDEQGVLFKPRSQGSAYTCSVLGFSSAGADLRVKGRCECQYKTVLVNNDAQTLLTPALGDG